MSREHSEVILILISGTFILTILSFFIIFFVVYYKKKAKKQKEERERMALRFKQELLQTQLEIQEQTLKTISQEIHDNIGQALTLAKLNLNTMLPVSDYALEQKIINSKELIGKSIADLRDLSHSMDTDYVMEMGLQRAIEYELERIQKSGVVNTVLVVEGASYKLNKQHELILFRIIQEAFNNCLKHAEATTLKVLIRYTSEGLSLEISDNGKGFDIVQVEADKKGLGTRNIQNRSQLIGAVTRFESVLNKGTSINIYLPVQTNTHDTAQEV